MNIGDKVRLLRGSEQGFITRILDNRMVEIEIEDGFRIPVMQSEIVVVSKEENKYFGKDKHEEEVEVKPNQNPLTEGIHLAFKAFRDDLLEVYLINQTSWQLAFSISESTGQLHQGKTAGLLMPGKHIKVTDKDPRKFEEWPELLVRIIRHKNEAHAAMPIIERGMRFKAASFYKAKKQAPLLGGEAYVFRIDDSIAAFDPQKLKESLTERTTNTIEQEPIKRPDKVIDLHIEGLVSNYKLLDQANILDIQLKTFESKLDQAIATGMDEITFIHGIGNGTLRNAIHKKLAGMKKIEYFADAQKEKFGYGATLIHIKR